jgi:hypothetical protein
MSNTKKIQEGVPEVKSFKNEQGEKCTKCPACDIIIKGA